MTWDISETRSLFPALGRMVGDLPAVFLDGPAGSQVPRTVADAVSRYLLTTNANHGAPFATAIESDALLDEAHQTLADFLGTDDPDTVCFGANMTTITLQVSRALARSWQPGDEVIVSRLDHDANFTPWILAAQEKGVVVHTIDLNPDDWTLNLNDFERKLSKRTRLVAVGYAANSTGTINPVRQIIAAAHREGALVYVDAVHYAPHGRINVSQLGCDFLVCSAYKFFGPHVGILWGKRELLEQIRPYKLRPSPDSLPGRWMTGTQNHEGIAGAAAAVDYIAAYGDDHRDADSHDDANGPDVDADFSRCVRLDRAFRRISTYERQLSERFMEQLSHVSSVRVHGITDSAQFLRRVPTFSVTIDGLSPREAAEKLAAQGIFAWAGNHYALPFTEAAGLEPDGTLRLGALHYNTTEEIDRVTSCLERLR